MEEAASEEQVKNMLPEHVLATRSEPEIPCEDIAQGNDAQEVSNDERVLQQDNAIDNAISPTTHLSNEIVGNILTQSQQQLLLDSQEEEDSLFQSEAPSDITQSVEDLQDDISSYSINTTSDFDVISHSEELAPGRISLLDQSLDGSLLSDETPPHWDTPQKAAPPTEQGESIEPLSTLSKPEQVPELSETATEHPVEEQASVPSAPIEEQSSPSSENAGEVPVQDSPLSDENKPIEPPAVPSAPVEQEQSAPDNAGEVPINDSPQSDEANSSVESEQQQPILSAPVEVSHSSEVADSSIPIDQLPSEPSPLKSLPLVEPELPKQDFRESPEQQTPPSSPVQQDELPIVTQLAESKLMSDIESTSPPDISPSHHIDQQDFESRRSPSPERVENNSPPVEENEKLENFLESSSPIAAPQSFATDIPKVEEKMDDPMAEFDPINRSEPKKSSPAKGVSGSGELRNLLKWRDLKKSAIVFSVGLGTLVLFSMYPLVTLFCWAMMLGMTASMAFVGYKQGMAKLNQSEFEHPFSSLLRDESVISPDLAHRIIDSLLRNSADALLKLKQILLCENIGQTFGALVLFWIGSYVGDWFSGLTIVFLMFIAAFSLPKIYEVYQKPIDKYIEMAKGKVAELETLVCEKVPMLRKVLKPKAE